MSLPERITCSACGKGVSTPVPAGTLVRAWVQCPECVEAEEASEEEALMSPHMCPHFCEPSECGTCSELAAAREAAFREGAEAARAVDLAAIQHVHDNVNPHGCKCGVVLAKTGRHYGSYCEAWQDALDAAESRIRSLPLPEVPRG